jgi:hypothetical protein
MKTIYIIKYCGGFEDYFENIIFATFNKKLAQKYVEKYNRILNKWKEHYRQYEDDEGFLDDIHSNYIYYRYEKILNLKNCFYEKIKIR